MSTFDPIVYNAVKQINAGSGGGSAARTIGELMLVPTGFIDADYVDVGSTFAASTYPLLADNFANASHISVLNDKGELPTVTALPTGITFAFSPVDSTIWALDTTSGHYFTSTDDAATFTFSDQYLVNPSGKPIDGYNYTHINLSTNGVLFRTTSPNNHEQIGSIGTYYRIIPFAANFFVAVNPSAAATVIQTSPDGVTWTSRTVPSLTYNGNGAWNGSMYVVLSTTTGYVSSPDGVTWTSRTAPFVPSNVKVIGTTFVMTPNTSVASLAYSTDGISWTTVAVTASGYSLHQTSTGLLAKSGTSAAYSTTDGITWTPVTMPATSSAIYVSEIRPVAIQVGTFPTYYTSTDLFATYTTNTWSVGAPTCDWSIIAASSTSIIVAEYNTTGVVHRSTDRGMTWTPITLPSTMKCTGLSYANNMYMAAGLPTVGYAISTDDGVTWGSVIPWPPTQAPTIANIICKDQLDYFYVWVGNASVAQVFRSSDGVKWTFLTGLYGGGLANNAWVIIKDHLVGTSLIGTGTTGITINNKGTAKGASSWTGSISPMSGCRSMVTNGQIALAFPVVTGSAQYMYSFDGYAWAASTLPCVASIDAAIWNGTQFMCFSTTAGQAETQVLISRDGFSWEVTSVSQYVDPTKTVGMHRQITPFVHDGVTYMSITNYRNLLAMEQTNPPKVPYVSPPSPSTKYVVKAK